MPFQLTASQGGWRLGDYKPVLKDLISTHSLTRRLTHYSVSTWQAYTISTHSLTRRLTSFFLPWFSSLYISTHSLTRRLTHCLSSLKPLRGISTHSLTRRLTMKQTYYKLCLDYFNSQPHKEADRSLQRNICDRELFQLTASQGGWHINAWWPVTKQVISTHSLTRRLTVSDSPIFPDVSDFNSQPHKEADLAIPLYNWLH